MPTFHPPTPAEISAALETYVNILTTKYSYLQAGLFLPDPVPEELLAPFGDFANKYGIGPAMQLFNLALENDGNIWEVPAVQAIKECDISLAQAFLSGFLSMASGETQDIYTSAARVLGQDVFYNS